MKKDNKWKDKLAEKMKENLNDTKTKQHPKSPKAAFKEEILIHYYKNGEYKVGNLFTSNEEEIIDWAIFINPSIEGDTSYQKIIISSFEERLKIHETVEAGVSLYKILFNPKLDGLIYNINFDN